MDAIALNPCILLRDQQFQLLQFIRDCMLIMSVEQHKPADPGALHLCFECLVCCYSISSCGCAIYAYAFVNAIRTPVSQSCLQQVEA